MSEAPMPNAPVRTETMRTESMCSEQVVALLAAFSDDIGRLEGEMDELRRDVLRQIGLILTAIPVTAALPAAATAASAPGATSQGGSKPVYTRRRSSPLPAVIRKPADLVAAKLMLPFSKSNTRSPISYPNYSRGSYKSVGLTPYMGTTGERQEIGLVTDAEGMWLCGGSPNNMLVQAEAHGDVPVHFGKVDLRVTPWAQAYENSPSKGSPFFDKTGYDVQPEVAHYPSLSYIPYLATGDQFYLEELQAEATFQMIAGPGTPDYRPLLDGGQPRGLAWALRSMTSAFLATPETVPDHLLPKSYWKQMLDKHRDAVLAKYVNSPDPRIQAFRGMIIDMGYWVAPWEQDFLGAVLGWMVWSGQLDDWRPIYDWSIQQAIRRAAFGSKAIGYHWTIGKATDYASLIAANPEPVGDPNYKAYFRANLKIAVLNNVPGAQTAFKVADGMARFVPYKWAV